jgi:hypothetical protein
VIAPLSVVVLLFSNACWPFFSTTSYQILSEMSSFSFIANARSPFMLIFLQGIFSGTTQTLLVCVSESRSSCTFVTTASKGYMNSVLLGVSAVFYPQCSKLPLNKVQKIYCLLIHIARRAIFATNTSATFKVDHLDAWVISKLMTWATSISYRLRLTRYNPASPILLFDL